MNVTLRPATAEDAPFVRQLVLDTVSEELMADSWPEPMRSHLLEIQYSSRLYSIRARFASAQEFIILADTCPVGWIVKADLGEEIRWIELMVRSESRGKGVATAALSEQMAEADRLGKPGRFSVSVGNVRAIRLYESLGFRRTGGDDTQHFMEYVPAPGARSDPAPRADGCSRVTS
jgi:RimJ/RimL family protein N-acetyltransferase